MTDHAQLRSVRGSVVLVTGAASGMGRATAEGFAAEGAHVAVTDFNKEGAEAVAGAIEAKAWKLDVSDGDEIRAVVDEIAQTFGRLDIVINNAGISAFS